MVRVPDPRSRRDLLGRSWVKKEVHLGPHSGDVHVWDGGRGCTGGILAGWGVAPEVTVRDWRKQSIFRQCCCDIQEHDREGHAWEVPRGLVRTTELASYHFPLFLTKRFVLEIVQNRKDGLVCFPFEFLVCRI